MRALIIEDEFLLAVSLEDVLRDLGYSSIQIVPSFSEAIAAARVHDLDLILADHRIIGGTGTDAVLAICSESPTPVVFVTGSEDEVRRKVADAVVVRKPYRVADLLAAIHVVLGRDAMDSCTPAARTLGCEHIE